MQCSTCCPLLRHTRFSPKAVSKGVYDISGKGTGYHFQYCILIGPAYLLIPDLYLFRSLSEQMLSCLL